MTRITRTSHPMLYHALSVLTAREPERFEMPLGSRRTLNTERILQRMETDTFDLVIDCVRHPRSVRPLTEEAVEAVETIRSVSGNVYAKA